MLEEGFVLTFFINSLDQTRKGDLHCSLLSLHFLISSGSSWAAVWPD